ncbi:hypothetical protein LEP1GSC055_2486 [Leptospira borgpetersenii str. Brem 307]|uniref:Uncharacterized protein n=1 Tax=Leptospira borgpetersenii str. Brem 328 TaxID=1049780 RepID=A0ABC9SLB6_LEPBO|nr:hypothetical protein LEP1GSC055_2486 [Leptospira borgpetersenii str. Brem 307]EMN18629.1 hypothetical protein LEP1GSC056_2185 [Leptospira borgpetersenii str. Brem 328]
MSRLSGKSGNGRDINDSSRLRFEKKFGSVLRAGLKTLGM